VKKLLWLALGVSLGVVAARRFASTPTGRELVKSVDSRAKEFGDAVSEAYRTRQEELREAIARAEDARRK
jgi:hypothetical protein